MKKTSNVKRICSFCVSDWHFITMITPYINKKIKTKEKLLLYTSQNYSQLIRTFLPKLMIENKQKKQIENLNWKESNIKKYSQVEEMLNNIESNKITIIVKGENTYIEKIDSLIEKWAEENKDKKISIINCFDVGEFNQNLGEILKKHDKILNTSGEKNIADVFEGVS